MDFEVVRIREITPEVVEAFGRLVPQLSQRAMLPGAESLRRVVESPQTRLYVVRSAGGYIAGALALALYDIPTGRRAWIEDVVVDASWRGRGCGRALVARAVEEAAAAGAGSVMLTSAPHRREARALYAGMGFVAGGTDIFKLNL